MGKIRLPYNFTPRPYQLENVFKPFDRGAKRIVEVWHRRAGKDKTALNLMGREMYRRIGSYYYILPTYTQGRKIVWEGMDATGFKFLDHIPLALRKRTSNQDMMIELKNGSIFRVVGSDNVDTIVGTNPVGIVYSEYSLHDPRAWDLFRPVLRENGGWAAFTYTPRGRNHGYRLYKLAQKLVADGNPEWYASLLKWTDTGTLTAEDIEMERMSGMEDELIEQEYNCSFAVGAKGAFYARQIEYLRSLNRLTSVVFDPSMPVFTFWDLGRSDQTCIWFVQFAGNSILIPWYLESHTHALEYYISRLGELKKQFGIRYAEHWLPWDAVQKSLGQPKSVEEQLTEGLIKNHIDGVVMRTERLGVADGVNAARALLSRCWFDETNAARGIDCLENYTKVWDDKNKRFQNEPLHNWACHGADAFRTMAISGVEELKWSNYNLDPPGTPGSRRVPQEGDEWENDEHLTTVGGTDFNVFK